MTHHITITYAYGIDGATGRVDSMPHATFSSHDDTAFEFLRQNVRGYRGPMHPVVTAVYATLATAAGFKVEVKHNPKPTPAQARAVVKAAMRQFDPHSTVRDTAATLSHFARKP